MQTRAGLHGGTIVQPYMRGTGITTLITYSELALFIYRPSMARKAPPSPRFTGSSAVTAFKSMLPYRCGNNGAPSALLMPSLSPTGAAASKTTCSNDNSYR